MCVRHRSSFGVIDAERLSTTFGLMPEAFVSDDLIDTHALVLRGK
jgi:hypothetical protein